jgi:hypothetical protein
MVDKNGGKMGEKWWKMVEKWWKNGWKCHGKYYIAPAIELLVVCRLFTLDLLDLLRFSSVSWSIIELGSHKCSAPLFHFGSWRLQLRGTNDVETIFQFGRLKHLLLWHLWESPVAPGAAENPKNVGENDEPTIQQALQEKRKAICGDLKGQLEQDMVKYGLCWSLMMRSL